MLEPRPLRRTAERAAVLALLALCSLVPCGFVAAAGEPATHAATSVLAGRTMGTSWRVTVATPSSDLVSLKTAIEAELARIDASLSNWRADSELARFNASGSTAWTEVSPGLDRVVEIALDVGARSAGALDITVAPLVALWGFGPAAIAEALRHVGPTGIQRRPQGPPALRKTDPAVTLDLSAVAKGYAVDRIGDLLHDRGLEHYLVEIGGELVARGSAPLADNTAAGARSGRRPWSVALERPDGAADLATSIVALNDAALATSGDYRRRALNGGRALGHVLDPRTGEPAAHHLAAVSVIHASCAQADAWATALLVLGPDAGLRTAEDLGLAARFVERRDGRLRETQTAGFERYVLR